MPTTWTDVITGVSDVVGPSVDEATVGGERLGDLLPNASALTVTATGGTTARTLAEWLGDLFGSDNAVSLKGPVKLRNQQSAQSAPAFQFGNAATGLTQIQYGDEVSCIANGRERWRSALGGFGIMTGAGVASSGGYLKADGHGNWIALQSSAQPNPIEFLLYSSALQGRATATSGGNTLARVSGSAFTASMVGRSIWFNGSKYKVSAVADANTLTVTTTGGGAVSWGSTVTAPFFQVYTTGAGTCSVSGTTVTRTAGDFFQPFVSSGVEFKLTINGVTRAVAAYVDENTLTLSSAPGDVTGAVFAYELNVNDQLSTLRVQALHGSDEMNLSIFARPDYYGIASFIGNNGSYLPVRMGAGDTGPGSPLWTVEINPDHSVRLGGVAGDESLKVNQGTSGGRAVTVTGASASGNPQIGVTGGALSLPENVVVNHTAPLGSIFGTVADFQVQSASGMATVGRWANDQFAARLDLVKARGATGALTTVNNGDQIGTIYFGAADGSSIIPVGLIASVVDTRNGTNDISARLAFFVRPDAGSGVVEALRIHKDGALIHRNNATTIVNAASHVGTRSYNFAGLPAASSHNGTMVIVSDRSGRPAWSNGTNWIWADGSTVS